MSAQNTGRQSPEPETQAGKQGTDAPSKGTGVNSGEDNQQQSKDQLKDLSSNPKGPLDDHVAKTAEKTVENVQGETKF